MCVVHWVDGRGFCYQRFAAMGPCPGWRSAFNPNPVIQQIIYQHKLHNYLSLLSYVAGRPSIATNGAERHHAPLSFSYATELFEHFIVCKSKWHIGRLAARLREEHILFAAFAAPQCRLLSSLTGTSSAMLSAGKAA